jgi:hypothetical protein
MMKTCANCVFGALSHCSSPKGACDTVKSSEKYPHWKLLQVRVATHNNKTQKR